MSDYSKICILIVETQCFASYIVVSKHESSLILVYFGKETLFLFVWIQHLDN